MQPKYLRFYRVFSTFFIAVFQGAAANFFRLYSKYFDISEYFNFSTAFQQKIYKKRSAFYSAFS